MWPSVVARQLSRKKVAGKSQLSRKKVAAESQVKKKRGKSVFPFEATVMTRTSSFVLPSFLSCKVVNKQ